MRINWGVLFVAALIGIMLLSAITNNNTAFEVAGKQAVPTFYVPYWFGSYGGKVMLFTIFALMIFLSIVSAIQIKNAWPAGNGWRPSLSRLYLARSSFRSLTQPITSQRAKKRRAMNERDANEKFICLPK